LRVFGIAWLAMPVLAYAQPNLQYELTPGKAFGYRVKVVETTYPGNGANPTRVLSNETPIRLKVLSLERSRASVEVTKGPLVVNGRSVGRAKVSTEIFRDRGGTNDEISAPFFILMPVGGVRFGQIWIANFSVGPPLPAGMSATYKYDGATKDGKYAIVTVKVKHSGASEVKGTGKLLVRLSDGLLESGNVTLNVLYLRPDPNDRSKMKVNERVEFKYTIGGLKQQR
jgi:hypothetical protein